MTSGGGGCAAKTALTFTASAHASTLEPSGWRSNVVHRVRSVPVNSIDTDSAPGPDTEGVATTVLEPERVLLEEDASDFAMIGKYIDTRRFEGSLLPRYSGSSEACPWTKGHSGVDDEVVCSDGTRCSSKLTVPIKPPTLAVNT
jgi:hypothetical protein